MKQFTIKSEFQLAVRAYIYELEMYGTVIGIYYSHFGIQYEIRYFFDGEAQTVYFFPWEIGHSKKGG